MVVRNKQVNTSFGNSLPQHPKKLKQIRDLIRDYAAECELVPPLQEEDVIFHSGELIQKHPELFLYQKLLAVMINNYAWSTIVAGIPFNRRILLLPKCISHSSQCPAKYDELGLLCEQCGRCDLAEIIAQADEFGYHTIVSEGTTSASILLSSGQVECVIGVGCLHSFERTFPLAVKEAVPSIAIPLYNNDCKDSKVDRIWLDEVLAIRNESNWKGWINLESLKQVVKDWFTIDKLSVLFGKDDPTINIAINWMEKDGKRWRPMIMVAVYDALTGNGGVYDETIQKLAVSIECFHKASLVHDDIADEDDERYRKPTLHKEYDIPVALNVGDLLVGFGYQMVAESGAKNIRKLLSVASNAHRDLSLGQGEELLWRRNEKLLTEEEIIRIFSNKTSPAFEVALQFGAILAVADEQVQKIISEYSNALGIAYQIKDDLDDFKQESIASGFNTIQPSLVSTLLNKSHPEKMQEWYLRNQKKDSSLEVEFLQWEETQKAMKEAEEMLIIYKRNALKALKPLKNTTLKILLTRLLNRIVPEMN
ncbi:polyprenyl synthetase family protein [Labilibaculum sp.]|uniref:polyprenyl synthetase family protein n=1 Tax=Labilibaculum sp. TaxID=2060723 RepID=UPI0035680A1B